MPAHLLFELFAPAPFHLASSRQPHVFRPEVKEKVGVEAGALRWWGAKARPLNFCTLSKAVPPHATAARHRPSLSFDGIFYITNACALGPIWRIIRSKISSIPRRELTISLAGL